MAKKQARRSIIMAHIPAMTSATNNEWCRRRWPRRPGDAHGPGPKTRLKVWFAVSKDVALTGSRPRHLPQSLAPQKGIPSGSFT